MPGYTVNRDGSILLDTSILSLLKGYRNQPEFMNGGGYFKLSKYLAVEHGFYINHKKFTDFVIKTICFYLSTNRLNPKLERIDVFISL